PLPPAQATRQTRQPSGERSNFSSYPSLPVQSANMPNNQASGPNKHTGFYHDATEAMSAFPNSMPGQSVPQFPGQQNFSAPQASYPAMGQSAPQTYQGNNYANSMYVQPPLGATGQAYMYDNANRGKMTPTGKRSSTSMALIISLCVIIALVGVITLGAAVILKGRNSGQPETGGAVATATAPPTPTIEPTALPSPTPELSPTPVLTPTPTPDAGFQWCTPACAPDGYLIEYPATWSPGTTTDLPGYQYINPAAADEILAVKAPPGAAASQPGDLLANDLQTNFQSKPGYTPLAAPPTTATIGGTTWLTQTAYYQDATQQQIRVMVFATVYQQKSYIIELQANNTQFDTVNQQAFTPMLVSFSFQAVPAA
ncbi:MAG TPA: hypothetical protein VGN34_22320, partial [Ktedonobacteraceae bacterium]